MPFRPQRARDRVLQTRAQLLEERRLRRVGRLEQAQAIRLSTGMDADTKVLYGLAIAGAVIAFLYWRTVAVMQGIWEVDPNYSHGYLVPLVSGFFAWRAYKLHGLPARDEVPQSELTIGIIELAIGLGLHMIAWFANSPLLDMLALVGVLHGFLVILGGFVGARPYACAIMYLLFMAPLPVAIYQPIAIFMQQFVSSFSVATLQLFTIAAYREGYIVHVPGYTMEVGEACSGLRQLTAFLALSVAAAHLSDRRKWYKWALVMLSVPTAVASNCVRVTLTGVIMMVAGQEAAEGVWHTLEGLAVFIVGIGLFLAFAFGLMKLDDALLRRQGKEPPGSSTPDTLSSQSEVVAPAGLRAANEPA